MDDNNGELEELKIDRQRRAMARGDGDVTQSISDSSDSRVSTALRWFWGLVGAGIAGSVLLAANNLYQLNMTVARGIDADANRDSRLNDHEGRLRQVERDVNMLAGKNLRGGPEEVPDGN